MDVTTLEQAYRAEVALSRATQGQREYATRLRLERFWGEVDAVLDARDRRPAWQRAPLPLFTTYPADVVHAMPERIRLRLGVPPSSTYIP